MHLGAISKCLPIFAAAGHFNYLKSAYLYLPDMTQLWSANSERCCMLYDELTDTGWDSLGLGLSGNRTDNCANAEVCRTTNMLFQTESKSQYLDIQVSGESEWRANH